MLSRLVISTIVPELRYAEVIHVNPTATFTSGLPTIRELSHGGPNRNAECGYFYGDCLCPSTTDSPNVGFSIARLRGHGHSRLTMTLPS
jgi:hypothetical protein